MKLSIILPAYNEEEGIAEIIRRCVEARDHICSHTALAEIEIIVVDDGSKDNTYKIASEFEKSRKITLISHTKNRGYGAAIKNGFEKANGDYVAFLDADGTCDPKYFVELFLSLDKNKADISVGSRMGPHSEMPKIRRLGNLIYASLINFICSSKITDSASGMRLIKKESLRKIYPLPNGMNFTPAMTAKSVLDSRLKIVETFMPYKERVGKSKLKVVRDGYRFLKTILEIIFFYRPFRFFALCAWVLFGISLLYGIPLLLFYFTHHRIRESDIYRIISIMVMDILGVNLLLLGMTAEKIVSVFTEEKLLNSKPNHPRLKEILSPSFMSKAGGLMMLFGVVLNYKTIGQYLKYREIYMHWSYVLVGAFFVLLGTEIVAYAFMHKLLWMYQEVLEFRRERSKG